MSALPPAPSPGMEYGHQALDLMGDTHFRAFLHGPREVPLHWHSEMEIVAILRGAVGLSVAGEAFTMSAGDVIIINPNVIHSTVSWADDAVVYGIHLDAEHYDRNGLPGFAERHYLCRSFLHGVQFEKVAGPIRSLVARIVLNSSVHPEEAMARTILANLLSYFIYRRVPWEAAPTAGNGGGHQSRERVQDIMRMVRANPNINLGEIAEKEGVTLSHLSRLFRSSAGIGFRDFAQNIRLDRAAEMLRNTRRTITEVREDVGFLNPTHFFAKFRERFGCSPAEYRRRRMAPESEADIPRDERDRIARFLQAEIARIGGAFDLLSAVPGLDSGHFVLAAPHNQLLPPALSSVA